MTISSAVFMNYLTLACAILCNMKLPAILILLVLLLLGCYTVKYSPSDVKESFYLQDDPLYLSLYNDTNQCIKKVGFTTYPNDLHIILLGTFPLCDGIAKVACVKFSNHTLTTHIAYKYNSTLLRHEFVHALTFLGNSYHDKEPFLSCGNESKIKK